jgi:hypothetical protein
MIQQDPVFKSIEFLTKRLEIARQQRSDLMLLYKEKPLTPQEEKVVNGLNLLINEIEYQITHISNYKDGYQ